MRTPPFKSTVVSLEDPESVGKWYSERFREDDMTPFETILLPDNKVLLIASLYGDDEED